MNFDVQCNYLPLGCYTIYQFSLKKTWIHPEMYIFTIYLISLCNKINIQHQPYYVDYITLFLIYILPQMESQFVSMWLKNYKWYRIYNTNKGFKILKIGETYERL